MKAMTGDLCWVASLLLQLRIVLTLSSYSSQFVFFPSKIFWLQIWKKSKVHFSWYLMKKKKEPWEPLEPFTVLRTVRSDRGSHGSLLFSSRTVLDAKRTAKMSGSRFFRSDRTVRSGFHNHESNIEILTQNSSYSCLMCHMQFFLMEFLGSISFMNLQMISNLHC